MPTTHVFIVDSNTFKYHLEYLFAGTGAKDYVIDFNNSVICALNLSSFVTYNLSFSFFIKDIASFSFAFESGLNLAIAAELKKEVNAIKDAVVIIIVFFFKFLDKRFNLLLRLEMSSILKCKVYLYK